MIQRNASISWTFNGRKNLPYSSHAVVLIEYCSCQKHQVELSMNTITVSDLTFSYFCERYPLTVSTCLFKRQLKQLAEKRTLLNDNQWWIPN